MRVYITLCTVGGDKLIFDPRRSCGQVLECRRIGRPPPGVPPGELAQDGAIRIFGVIRVLSESRLLVNVLATLRKLLSLPDEVNHPPNITVTSIRTSLVAATLGVAKLSQIKSNLSFLSSPERERERMKLTGHWILPRHIFRGRRWYGP